MTQLGCSSAPKGLTMEKEIDFMHRSENLVRIGKQKEGLEEIQTAISLSPNSARLHGHLSRLYQMLKRHDLAIEPAQRMISLDPNDPVGYMHLGSSYYYTRQYNKALENYLAAYKILPEDPESTVMLGWGYVGVGDKKTASAYFAKYLELGSNRNSKINLSKWMTANKFVVPEFESKVVSLLETRKFDQVEENLRKMVSAKKLDADGESQITAAYEDLIKIGDTRIFEEWATARPSSALAKSVLGAAYIAKAWSIRGGGYSDTVNESANIKFAETIGKAKQSLEESRKMDPTNAETIHRLLMVAKADRTTSDKIGELYRDGMAIDSSHFGLSRQMQDVKAPKWGGSTVQLFEFSRNVTKIADEGSKVPLLVVRAHWEMANSLFISEPSKYFRQPGVWEECRPILDTVLKRFPNSVQVKTYYVRTAYAAGDLQNARKYFNELKDKWDVSLWNGGIQELLTVKRGLASAE